MTSTKHTMLVKYKNVDGKYSSESKLPYIEINADKFNPEYHKKLFWRNLWRDSIKTIKINGNNGWIVGIGSTVIGGIILYLIVGK